MAIAVVNDFTTTVATGIDDNDTSLVVAAAVPGVGATDTVRMRNTDTGEIFDITANANTTTWTISRAVEDATRFPAAAMSTSDTLEQILTVAGVKAVPRMVAAYNPNGAFQIGAAFAEYTTMVDLRSATITPGYVYRADMPSGAFTPPFSGFEIESSVNPGSNPGAAETDANGARTLVVVPTANSTTLTNLLVRGMQFVAEHRGTGTLGTLRGMEATLIKNSTGSVSIATGAQIGAFNLNAGGVITDYYGALLSTPYNVGTITNTYGLYVQAQVTGAGGTHTNTPWGIVQAGAADLNRFAGDVRWEKRLVYDTAGAYTGTHFPTDAVIAFVKAYGNAPVAGTSIGALQMRVTARGAGDVSTQRFGLRIQTGEPGVTNKTITGMSRSGTTITVTATSHGYSNGEDVVIYGVTHTFNVEINKVRYSISNVAANTFDITVAGLASGSYTSGGTATNRPYLFGVGVFLATNVARNGADYDNGDDVAAYTAQNINTFKQTDGYYLAASPAISGPAWSTGMNVDADCELGAFRYGGEISVGGSVFNAEFATVPSGSWVLTGPNNVPIVAAKNQAGTFMATGVLKNTSDIWEFGGGRLRIDPANKRVTWDHESILGWTDTDWARWSFDEGNRVGILAHHANPVVGEQIGTVDLYLSAMGAGDVTTSRTPLKILAGDENSVVDRTITNMVRSGTTITVTTSVAHGFINGDKIAIYGSTNTFNVTPHNVWAITNASGSTFDITVAGLSSGTWSSGGTATNRPLYYGALVLVAPRVARDAYPGATAILNGDDIGAFAAQNVGSAAASDAFYLGKSPTVSGRDWRYGFVCDADATAAFRSGANVIDTAVLDASGATVTDTYAVKASAVQTYGGGYVDPDIAMLRHYDVVTTAAATLVTVAGSARTVTSAVAATNQKDARGEWLRISATVNNADSSLSSAGAMALTRVDFDPVFRSVVQIPTAIVNMRVFIGLFSAAPVMTTDTQNTIHSAYFRFSTAASDTTWKCCTSNATSTTVTSTTVTVAANTVYHLRIDARDAANIKFFINGVRVATNTATLPTTTTNIGPGHHLRSLSASGQKDLDVGFTSVYQAA